MLPSGTPAVPDDFPRSVDIAAHLPSHAALLRRNRASRVSGDPVPPDLVVVPASRSDARLDHAAGVARMVGCPLIVLCSREIKAIDVDGLLDGVIGRERVLAVDVERGFGAYPVRLETDWLEPRRESGRRDVSHKRNLAVALAVMLELRSVLFLDDDVFGLAQVGQLDDMAHSMARQWAPGRPMEAVGWRFVEFPDNSVVCHARRRIGWDQDSFIGGGGLQVRCTPDTPFFPNVYNEDWLFLFDLLARRTVVLAGDLYQESYDPFRTPEYAARQEFGDVLGESLFSLLHGAGDSGSRDGSWPEPVLEPARDSRWWYARIRGRQDMIRAMLREVERRERVPGSSAGQRRYVPERVIDSLEAALQVGTPGMAGRLAAFVSAWRADRRAWREFLHDLPRGEGLGLGEGLRLLGQREQIEV